MGQYRQGGGGDGGGLLDIAKKTVVTVVNLIYPGAGPDGPRRGAVRQGSEAALPLTVLLQVARLCTTVDRHP